MALAESFHVISRFLMILATQNALGLIGGIVNCRFEGVETLVGFCVLHHMVFKT